MFLDLGGYFVPEREAQMQILCDLIAVGDRSAFLVELCCGEGLLSRALLERFPRACVLAFDGSARMVKHARHALAEYGDRFRIQQFDLADVGWRHFSQRPDAVVSSLAIHHLDDAQKLRLYRDIASLLAPGGAFLIADVVRPASKPGIHLAARRWDDAVRKRCAELASGEEIHARFCQDGWNMYENLDADPADKPSEVFEQLKWLEAAGLIGVDVFWMNAGHAIFGGYAAKVG
jgi:SAM-dependent methyltransferase